MSNETNWIDPETSGSTRSSQDTLCSQDNATCLKPDTEETKVCLSPQSHSLSLFQNLNSIEDATSSIFSLDPVYVDEDTQMCVESSLPGGSPNDLISPGCEPGDVSSPFETMESDDHNDADDSIFSASSVGGRRLKWNTGSEIFSTPRDSSDEDPYASSGSRKKRRRLKKEMHPSDKFAQSRLQYYSPSPQISSPVSVQNGNEQLLLQGITSSSKSRGNLPLMFNSDTLSKNIRRASNASESNQSSVSCTRDNSISFIDNSMGVNNSSFTMDGDILQSGETSLTQPFGNSGLEEKSANNFMSLQVQYPSASHGYSLEILTQPEEQHRARYLTEGSRGAVKDHSQQSFPKIQLKGFTGKTTLHVYVGSDSEDKVRPHGFYQACKITGRNNTTCKEIEIEGTKVIQVPFDAQTPISVDCVGILKLRNADVELRIGRNRAKKKSQTVRLVFRVLLDVTGNDSNNPLILQVVSNRIMCSQPRGQPEIIKKSLERCPVEGNQEMFIIGRNFHRGVKVIFQDSEEPDGSHWHELGLIDKDTFNQSHLIVNIPPYHDQNITKSVNVQLFVENDGRKCDPHSFTYDPSPKLAAKEVTTQEKDAKTESEEALQSILKIDRKLLEALLKLTPTDKESLEPVSTSLVTPVQVPSLASSQTQNSNLTNQIPVNMQGQQPLFFTSDNKQLSSSIQKPVPMPGPNSLPGPPVSRTLIRPTSFNNINSQTSSMVLPVGSSNVVMTPQPFKLCAEASAADASNPPLSNPFQVSATSGFNTVSATTSAQKSQQDLHVKTEEQAKIWPSTELTGAQVAQANPGSSGIAFSLSPNVSFVNSVSQPSMIISNQQSAQQHSVVNQIVNNPTLQAQPQTSIPTVVNHVIHYTPTLQEQELPLNTSVTNVVHVINTGQTVQSHGQALQSVPIQTNVSVSEVVASNPTFASSQNQWTTQSMNSGTDIAFTQNSVASQSPMFVNFSQTSTQSANTNSIIVSNGFENVQTEGWVSTKSMPSIDDLTPQNSNSNAQSAMQWQPVPAQNNTNESLNLKRSSSGALIFSADSSLHNSMTNQQQVFTLANAMDILEHQPKGNSNPSTAPQSICSDSFSNAVSPLDSLSNVTVEESSHELLNPDVLPDDDLHLGFEPGFHDGSVLQTIISDCFNASSGPVEGHVFPQKLISPPNASNPTSPTQISSFASSLGGVANLQVNPSEQIQAQPQQTSSDIEMMPASSEKRDFNPANNNSNTFLNQQVVDASMFVVDSMQQQQQHQQLNQNTSMSNTADPLHHSSLTYSMPSQLSSSLPLNSSGNNIGSSKTCEVFQTINTSVLNIDSGNTLNQAFPTFDQTQSSNSAGS